MLPPPSIHFFLLFAHFPFPRIRMLNSECFSWLRESCTAKYEEVTVVHLTSLRRTKTYTCLTPRHMPLRALFHKITTDYDSEQLHLLRDTIQGPASPIHSSPLHCLSSDGLLPLHVPCRNSLSHIIRGVDFEDSESCA